MQIKPIVIWPWTLAIFKSYNPKAKENKFLFSSEKISCKS